MRDRLMGLIKKVGWPVFWLVWFFLPVVNRWFGRVDCQSCFREQLIDHLAFFGYVVVGGFIYSFSKPSKEGLSEEQRSAIPAGYMLGTREDVLLCFALFGLVLTAFFFLGSYSF